MIKVTIKPKDGSKPVVKSFHTPQESIAFINSYVGKSSSRPTTRAADVCPTTADNSLHRWVPDGDNEICLNCGTRR